MKLLTVYVVLVILGQAAVVGLGELIELTFPNASLLAFLGLFFVMLWAAWQVALKVTPE